MTDKEKLEALLVDFGLVSSSAEEWYSTESNFIVIDESSENTDKVGGYTGFYTVWEFDDAGKFVTVGAWE